jgi:hypothetical protein
MAAPLWTTMDTGGEASDKRLANIPVEEQIDATTRTLQEFMMARSVILRSIDDFIRKRVLS